ncbi:MAG: hypothetical protein ACFE8A_07615 [Candidatus Hodarchaeota archaeon]
MNSKENLNKNYTKLEKGELNNVYTKRIHSIDFLKGVAIYIIILINTAEIWINKESRFVYAIIYLYLDVIGTSLFIFLFSLSVIFLWKKKMGISPSKEIRNDILTRGLILIILGIGYNIISTSITLNMPLPLNLWGWNILIFIGFAQIISYYAVKLSRGARWIIGFLFFFASTPIRELLILGKNTNQIVSILHFIIISPNPQTTILPYIALCFFSTIFGERLLECLQLDAKVCNLETFHTLIIFGFIFLFIGISYGYGLVTPEILDPEDYPMIKLIPILETQSFFPLSKVPGYLIRGTAPNLLYGLGVALIILGCTFYLLDILYVQNAIIKMFDFYGKVSLSLFFIHCVGLLFFIQQLTIVVFFIAYFFYIGFLGLLMYLWFRYAKGVGTLKWLISKTSSRHK